MKVYLASLVVLDFENMGEEEIIRTLETNKYISPSVLKIESREIGIWRDSHPLNSLKTHKQEVDNLFGTNFSDTEEVCPISGVVVDDEARGQEVVYLKCKRSLENKKLLFIPDGQLRTYTGHPDGDNHFFLDNTNQVFTRPLPEDRYQYLRETVTIDDIIDVLCSKFTHINGSFGTYQRNGNTYELKLVDPQREVELKDYRIKEIKKIFDSMYKSLEAILEHAVNPFGMFPNLNENIKKIKERFYGLLRAIEETPNPSDKD